MAGLASPLRAARARLPALLRRALSLNAHATDQLAKEQDPSPVTVVQLLRFCPADRGPALAALDAYNAGAPGKAVADLTPHPEHSVLLGDPDTRAFDRVAFRQFGSSAEAHAYVTGPCLADAVLGLACAGSLLLRATPATFAALPPRSKDPGAATFLDTAPPTGQGVPSPCPFVHDPTSQPTAWASLHDTPSAGGMVAMNLINVPPHLGDAYQEV